MLSRLSVYANGVAAAFDHSAEFSLAGALDLTETPRSDDREACTGVGLQSSAEVIARKVARRMLRRGQYLVRDAYDVVCCLAQDPTAFELALSTLSQSDRDIFSMRARAGAIEIDRTRGLRSPRYDRLRDSARLRELLIDAVSGTLASDEAKMALGGER